MKDMLTISQAAEFLNVPEGTIQKLISDRILPTRLDGAVIPQGEVLSYRSKRDSDREAALNEMVVLVEESGLPY